MSRSRSRGRVGRRSILQKPVEQKEEPKASFQDVFEKLNDAVSAEYWKDPAKAGVVTSKISHDPPLYYASVARYSHPATKQIVESATGASLEDAVRAVAMNWLSKVMPPPAVDLKTQLKGLL